MARNRAHEALRSATADCHRTVDEIYSLAKLDDRLSYSKFLRAQSAAYLPIETALDRAGIADVVDDWPQRIRTPLLIRDLAELGVERPALFGSPAIAGEPEMLGALYVLEGSRLGGKILMRAVPASFPASFLSWESSATWRAFLTQLDQILDTEERRGRAIDAARNVFSIFGESGQLYL